MKKKLLLAGAALLLAAAAVTGYSAYEESNISELFNANVEALTQQEVNPDCPNGCQANGDGCYCYDWYENYLEAKWD